MRSTRRWHAGGARAGGSGPAGRDDGVVAVLVALVVTFVVVPLLALILDLGLARAVQQRVGTAADSAALAAAVLHPRDLAQADEAAADARRYIAANLDLPADDPAWASCLDGGALPVVPGPGTCVSFDLDRRLVRVLVPGRVTPSAFAGVLGAAPPVVSAVARATWAADPRAARPCVLCVLTDAYLGRERAQVQSGDVDVAEALNIDVGGALEADPGTRVRLGVPYVGLGVIAPGWTLALGDPVDPLAGSDARVTQGLDLAAPAAVGSGVCPPGSYVDLSGCASFTGGGVYVVTGRPAPAPRVPVTLGADLTDATVYLTCARHRGTDVVPLPCSTPGASPTVRFAGGGPAARTMTGRAELGGLALVVDPGAVGPQPLVGPGGLTVRGDVHAPGVTLAEGAIEPGQLRVEGTLVLGRVNLFRHPGRTGLVVRGAARPDVVRDGPARLVE